MPCQDNGYQVPAVTIPAALCLGAFSAAYANFSVAFNKEVEDAKEDYFRKEGISSLEVEGRDKVIWERYASAMQAENSHHDAQNDLIWADYRICSERVSRH